MLRFGKDEVCVVIGIAWPENLTMIVLHYT